MSFHKLIFTVMFLVVYCVYPVTCQYAIVQMVEIITIQILAYFDSLFYHFGEFQKIKSVIVGFSITYTKHWCHKCIENAHDPSLQVLIDFILVMKLFNSSELS